MRWLHDAYQRARRAKKTQQGQTETLNFVQKFVDSIPNKIIVSSSINCSSFARALQHQEMALRNLDIKETEDKQEMLAVLQRIYAALDDPDSVDGLASIITSPTLEQQIIQHEVCGRWPAAQTCYEILLQKAPDEITYQLGLLESLQNMGHYGIINLSRIYDYL